MNENSTLKDFFSSNFLIKEIIDTLIKNNVFLFWLPNSYGGDWLNKSLSLSLSLSFQVSNLYFCRKKIEESP